MKRARGGFTLIELIIVIVIVGILALVAIPRYFANIENARRAEANSTLRSIKEAIMAYYAVTNTLPASNTWPITAVMQDGGSMNMVLPVSSNFSYTYTTSGLSCTITATHSTGTIDYTMTL